MTDVCSTILKFLSGAVRPVALSKDFTDASVLNFSTSDPHTAELSVLRFNCKPCNSLIQKGKQEQKREVSEKPYYGNTEGF